MATILVVEDDERSYFLINSILTNDQCNTIHAKNGVEALSLVENHIPDLILMDIRMPHMSGWDVAKTLKAKEHTQSIPLIAMSALTEENMNQRILDTGFELFLPKPFSVRELKAIVKQYLPNC